MREIRFRAWDGYRFYYFSNHAYTLDYNDISGWNVRPNTPDYRGEWTTGQSSRSAEKFDLQQFTGMADKNKKDIYEGDILEDIWGARLEVFSFIDETHALSGFAFRPIKKGDVMTPHVTHQSWLKVAEIIGNTYEHPHLLEQSEANHD